MSAPPVLLVDDSEAILAYEQAALGSTYAVSTARDGSEALAKMRELSPAVVLLDLSMPTMDGEEVVRRAATDPELCRIPIIIVTSETSRAEACLRMGAAAFVPKPIHADELRSVVSRVLEQTRARMRERGLEVLPVRVGQVELALPLSFVRVVALMPAPRRIVGAPFYLPHVIDFHGRSLAVLDLGALLGIERSAPLHERRLVVVHWNGAMLALSVDHIHDPQELPRRPLFASERSALSGCRIIGNVEEAVQGDRGEMLPVVDPRSLLPPRVFRKLDALVSRAESP